MLVIENMQCHLQSVLCMQIVLMVANKGEGVTPGHPFLSVFSFLFLPSFSSIQELLPRSQHWDLPVQVEFIVCTSTLPTPYFHRICAFGVLLFNDILVIMRCYLASGVHIFL